MENYIGLDAHSKTCTFVVLDAAGEITKTGTIGTSERNLREMVRSITGTKALVVEEANIAQWVFLTLKDEVDRLVVCHPAYLPKKSGPKNDFRDSLHLAQQLRSGNVTPVHHEDSFLMNLRSMVTAYETVNVRGATLKNQFKSLLRHEGITAESAHLTVTNPDKWKEIKNPVKRFVAENLYQQICENEAIKKKYVREFRVNILENKTVRNLASIPAIGHTRAHIIAAYICTGERFESKHKLWSYAKLVRHRDESDGYVIRKRTPHGRSELKAAFMGAAQRIVISKTKTALQDYYWYLREQKGLDEKKSRRALARKIAAICLMVMKKGTKYDDDIVRKSFDN